MRKGFISQEAGRTGKKLRKIIAITWAIVIASAAIVYIAASLDGSDIAAELGIMLPLVVCGVLGIMLAGTLAVLSRFPSASKLSYESALTVLSDKITSEEAGRAIDEDAAQGNFLLDERVHLDNERPRVILTPTYLVTSDFGLQAIPVSEIYWVCAQVGIQGGPFRVKLLVFSEKQMHEVQGWEIDHLKGIVEKIYRYVPNIFHEYDAFELSYKLEETYRKDRDSFLAFYETHKRDFFGLATEAEERREDG